MITEKRGQGLSVQAIVVVILALVVLVSLIYGFSVGWGNFFDFIPSNDSNIAEEVRKCQLACASGDRTAYCNLQRNITFGDDITGTGLASGTNYTCGGLQTKNVGLDSCSTITC